MSPRLPVAVFLLSACAGATPQLPAAPAGDPALVWRVSDADSHVYLLGSIHLLRSVDYPLREIYDVAYDQVHELIFEADLFDLAATEQALLDHAYYPPGQSLEDELSPWTIGALRNFLSQHPGYAYRSDLRGWFWETLVVALQASAESADPGLGVDAYFLGRALDDGRPVTFLETHDFQLRIFADRPPEIVEQSLIGLLSGTPGSAGQGIADLLQLWLQSDYEAWGEQIEGTSEGDLTNPYTIGARNAAWMPTLRQHLAQNRKSLVVVGTLHLPTSFGLLEMLTSEGYLVERLPEEPWIDGGSPMLMENEVVLSVRGAMGHDVRLERSTSLSGAWEAVSTLTLGDESHEVSFPLEVSQPLFLRFRRVD